MQNPSKTNLNNNPIEIEIPQIQKNSITINSCVYSLGYSDETIQAFKENNIVKGSNIYQTLKILGKSSNNSKYDSVILEIFKSCHSDKDKPDDFYQTLVYAINLKLEKLALWALGFPEMLRTKINNLDSNGNTVLIAATCYKLENVIKKILEFENIDINKLNKKFKTALDYCAIYNLKDIALIIIDTGKVSDIIHFCYDPNNNIDTANNTSHKPNTIMRFTNAKMLDIVDKLIEIPIESSISENVLINELLYACNEKYEQVVGKMLSYYPIESWTLNYDEDFNTIFMHCCINKWYDAALFILDHEIEPELFYKNKTGKSSLLLICESNDADLIIGGFNSISIDLLVNSNEFLKTYDTCIGLLKKKKNKTVINFINQFDKTVKEKIKIKELREKILDEQKILDILSIDTSKNKNSKKKNKSKNKKNKSKNKSKVNKTITIENNQEESEEEFEEEFEESKQEFEESKEELEESKIEELEEEFEEFLVKIDKDNKKILSNENIEKNKECIQINLIDKLKSLENKYFTFDVSREDPDYQEELANYILSNLGIY